jgi:DNA-binding beta-propeller fold protein YncE
VRYGNHLIADPAYAGVYKNVYSSPGELLAIDWQTGRILARRHEQPGDGPIAVGGGRLWAVAEKPAKILDLNPNTFAPRAPAIALGTGRLFGLTWGEGYLWATAGDDGDVLRIDPSTRTITRAHVGGFPIGIALAGGSVWVIDNANDKVLRLNPNTLGTIGHAVATPGGGAFYLGATDGYVFIANEADGTITRIDDQTGKTAGPPIRIAPTTTNPNYSAAYAVAPAGSAIWATSPTTDTVSRIRARP